MLDMDSRKQENGKLPSRESYPEDSWKTELIENLKYLLLVLPSESPHCDMRKNGPVSATVIRKQGTLNGRST